MTEREVRRDFLAMAFSARSHKPLDNSALTAYNFYEMIYAGRKAFIISGILLTAVRLFAQAPDTLWTKAYGGDSADLGNSVVQTSDGGYAIAGYTRSFGAAYDDVGILKIDSIGNFSWMRIYGGSDLDWGQSIQQTSDGGYVVAGFTLSYGAGSNDVYLIRTDSLGDTLWTKTYGGSNNDGAFSVQQTLDQGYIIAGHTFVSQALQFDVYVIKTDSIGVTMWTKAYGGSMWDLGRSVQQTSDSGYIIGGHTMSFGLGMYDFYLIKTDSLGDTLWTKTYGGTNDDRGFYVRQTSDGGYIMAGMTYSFGAGLSDVHLVRTDENGNTLWTKTYGMTSADEAWAVQETYDHGFIVTGYTYSPATLRDIYLIRTDANGDTLWTKTYGGAYDDRGYDVQQTSDSGYIIIGYTASFGSGNLDAYLIKTGPDLSGVEEEIVNPISASLFLEIYPNPFRKLTYIRFQITGNSTAKLEFYDAAGRLVKKYDEIISSANHIPWDGRDDYDRQTPRGVYFLTLKTDNSITLGKLIKLE